MKDIIKVINSLEGKEILLKGPIEKIVNQKEGFLSTLMRVGSPLTKNSYL